MRFFTLSILGFALILGCSSDDNKITYTYLDIHRGNYIDTVNWDLSTDFLQESDSFYIIEGIEYFGGTPDTVTIEFPKFDGIYKEFGLHRIDSMNINFEMQDFVIYKYVSGETIDDGSMLWYFVPSIGLIMYKAAAWGTYIRLLNTGNEKVDKQVFFLNDKLISDSAFFNH